MIEVNRSHFTHSDDTWISKYRAALAASDGAPVSQPPLTRIVAALFSVRTLVLSRIDGVLRRSAGTHRRRLFSVTEPPSLASRSLNLETSQAQSGARQAPAKPRPIANRSKSLPSPDDSLAS